MHPHVLYATMLRFIHRVSQEGAAELRAFGLTPAQYGVLVQVGRRPGMAQWELVEAFGVTKGNVSQLVKRLEHAGWLDRTRVQGTDELTLTPAGRALLDRVRPAHEAFMARQFAALDAGERETLERLISTLLEG